jgi:hypothetical protein
MCNRIFRRISKRRIKSNKEPLFSNKEATKKMGGFKVVGKTIWGWGTNYYKYGGKISHRDIVWRKLIVPLQKIQIRI